MQNKGKRTDKEILTYYQTKAPLSAMSSPLYQRAILQRFLADLENKVNLSSMKILDFGCGLGNNLNLLTNHFQKVVTVDVSQKAIDLAKKKYKSPKVKFLLIKDQKLPFKSSNFDFILAAEVLEHVPNLKKSMSELRRVLKKNGYLLISTPNYWNLRGLSKKLVELFIGEGYWDPGRAHPGGYERFMTPQKILQHLRHFRIIKTCGSDYGTAWSLPMVKLYPKQLDWFFEIELGKISLLKKFGMNFYVLAQKYG